MTQHEEYVYETMSGATREWIEEERRYQAIPKKDDDEVLRPDYYGGKEDVYEVFNVLEAWGLDKDFYLGNVLKYVARAGKKNKSKEKEDLQKALVYLQRRIKSL